LVKLGVAEDSFDNRGDDGSGGNSGTASDSSDDSGDNRGSSQTTDSGDSGDTFSPEAFFNQTLESSGYELGNDPCLDKCWEAFRRCLKNSTNGQACIAQLSACQRSCAASSAQSSTNELGSPGQSDAANEEQGGGRQQDQREGQ